jgi:uncharacterized membrane protein
MQHTDLTWFDKQSIQFEESRFAAMTILLTAQSCIGSIAVLFALEHNMIIQLCLTAAVTMGANSLFIAQGPAKWCLGAFYISIVVNLLIIIINVAAY